MYTPLDLLHLRVLYIKLYIKIRTRSWGMHWCKEKMIKLHRLAIKYVKTISKCGKLSDYVYFI